MISQLAIALKIQITLTRPEPRRRLSPTIRLNFIHLDTRTDVETSSGLALSQANHSTVLVKKSTIRPSSHSDKASLLSVGDIALRAIHLGLEITLPEVFSMVGVSVTTSSFTTASPCREVRLDGRGDSVLLDNVLMVEVGGISILQLLQSINDLVEARVNLHHFHIQELATLSDSWLQPSYTRVCLNFIHFDTWSRNQQIWLAFTKRFVVTPAVYPRLFKNLTTLTFGALRKNHIASSSAIVLMFLRSKRLPDHNQVRDPC